MKLLYLYSDSDFTPWRENINAATIASLIQATPEHVQSFVTHFVGFTAEFADFLRQFDLVFNVCYGYGVADQVEVVRWLIGVKHMQALIQPNFWPWTKLFCRICVSRLD